MFFSFQNINFRKYAKAIFFHKGPNNFKTAYPRPHKIIVLEFNVETRNAIMYTECSI